MKHIKSREVLQDFVKYCEEHPDERFWQALRNWSGADYIMYWSADEFNFEDAEKLGMQDTFYWEGKNGKL